MYVFRTNHLVLDQLVCSSLGKLLSRVEFWTFACLLVSSLYISMPNVVNFIQVMLRHPCWWVFLCVSSDILKRYNLTSKFLFLWLLQCFYTLFHYNLWPLGGTYIRWNWDLQFCILIVFYTVTPVSKRTFTTKNLYK